MTFCLSRRREGRLAKRAEQQADPRLSVPRLQPITHRQGSASLAPAIQVHLSINELTKKFIHRLINQLLKQASKQAINQ